MTRTETETRADDTTETDPDRWGGAVLDILRQPPRKWRELADQLGVDGFSIADDAVSDALTRAARAKGYFDARSEGASHAVAVRESNALVARVRATAGFTFPVNDAAF